MTFADELRSNKKPGPTKKEIAARQYWLNLHVRGVLAALKQSARIQNYAGKHSVSGYLALADYDNDHWRLLPIKDKIVPFSYIGAGGFGVNGLCYQDFINDLKSEVEEGLKQLGFQASVKIVEVQFYDRRDGFFGKELVKHGSDTTLRIDFSW